MLNNRLSLCLFAALLSPALSQQPSAARKAPVIPSTEQMKARVPAGVRFLPDIAYREGCAACTLDLSLPDRPSAEPRPVLVVVHGGGWRSGDKRSGTSAQIPLEYAQHGYVSMSINYRLADEGSIALCVEDAKCAVRWLRAHAKEYNVDPDRIGGFGSSAGAHLVAMLGLASRQAGLEGDGPYQDQSSMLQAVFAAATPTDFAHWGREGRVLETIRKILGGDPAAFETRARLLSPVTYASAAAPPFVLLQGTADETVPSTQAGLLINALRAAGAQRATLLIVDGAGHDVFGAANPMTRGAMMSFFDSTIGPGR